MSRQVVGPWAQLLGATQADNGAPSGDQAGRLVIADSFKAVPYTIDWQMFFQVTGTGALTADAYLWGRDDEDSEWGVIGLYAGHINNGTQLTGTDLISNYFGFQNIVAGFSDLWLEILNLSGTNVRAIANLRPIYNCEPNGY